MKTQQYSSIFETAGPVETTALAERFARTLSGGEILLLYGPIGTGKTVFVKGLAAAIGVRREPVSASFSLMRQYKGRSLRLCHVDLFRLEEGDMDNLGFEALLEDEESILAIEWAGPIEAMLPQDRLEITVDLLDGDRRRFTVLAGGRNSAALLKAVEESV